MPIFISYSQKDSDFVDTLAANLVTAKHHVWMDRWELNIGDSLTQKIEESLTGSSAILVILSENSVSSPWCKRELTAGLVRELEERQTLVLPLVIDDCAIPLFMKDKLYADFRKDPDEAFSLVDRALARISNATTSRSEDPEWHTDFAVDWKRPDDPKYEETWIVRWTFLDHGPKWPYSLLCECKVYVVEGGEVWERERRSDEPLRFIKRLLSALVQSLNDKPLQGLIEDNFAQFVVMPFDAAPGERYAAVYTYRRVGLDNGMDTVVHLDNNLKMALRHYEVTVAD